MKSKISIRGIALLLLATIAWGGMFPVAKATLHTLDAFYMTLIRYGITAVIFAAILWMVEGKQAFRFEGRALPLFFFGSMGFAGFSLFTFVGLGASEPEHGAIIVALMPILTALLNWAVKGIRPAAFTLGTIVLALFGVLLVVTKGNLHEVSAIGNHRGNLLILLGAISWVIYTFGAASFKGWSPLRYSTLSLMLGVISILLSTLAATYFGAAHVPSSRQLWQVGPEMAYIIVFASVAAVLGWNNGVKQLGPLNAVLFINFVPVTAFTIGALQGRAFTSAELAGAAIVLAALIANNLHARKIHAAVHGVTPRLRLDR
ncbi:MAG: DMT family transporter [Burkholderiales bacterium]